MSKPTEGSSIGPRLVEAAREMVRIHRGEIEPARVVRITVTDFDVESPPTLSPEEIRAVRIRMGVSQPIFAAALNVSPETVRAWEQGKRAPDGPSVRLLQIADQHPEVFLGQVRSRGGSRVVEADGGSDIAANKDEMIGEAVARGHR